MAIETTVIYEQAFQSFRHALDIRTRIVRTWLALFSAFVVALVWTLGNALPEACFVLLAAALLLTLMMWFADFRNRSAIARALDIGEHIETDPESEMPVERRYLSQLGRGFPHSALIDLFAVASAVLLVAAAVLLV